MDWLESKLSRKPKQDEGPYVIEFNKPRALDTPAEKRTNYISTTKYNIFTFLPLNLFNQFCRVYNLYFLLAAVISLLPIGTSPISPLTAVLPLAAVLVVTAIKDAYEDLKRWQADRAANGVSFKILQDGKPISVLSKDLRPGDILIVNKGQQFPADLVIIASSNEEGIAYIATTELDGETNLKRRVTIPAYADIHTEEEVSRISGTVECDQPNERLYQFQGRFNISNEEQHALSADQLLLRGAVLRNTTCVYGIVLYVGADTKIMRNLKSSRLKFSTLEGKVNAMVSGIFAFNLVILAISAILSGVFQAQTGQTAWWLDYPDSPASVGGLDILTYFILYTYMIPISLFVTIEISRICQALFMFSDDEMMSPDGIRMKPSNSNLNEDLGRIDHIFSDKTGTLTQNIMTLKYLYIDGKSYSEDGKGALGKIVRGESPEVKPEEREKLLAFMKAIAVCHAVIPSIDDNGVLIYEGDSPDEAALLDGMRPNGILVKARSSKDVLVEFQGKEERYALLNTLEFTSSRKRMSVIVREPSGEITVYCKGADNIIYDRVAKDKLSSRSSALLLSTIDDFSKVGLRTLLYSKLTLTQERYAQFQKQLHEAEVALEGREDKMAAAYELVERGFTLLGATAVEDKLQEDVADTIDYLLRCGIHVWMLTGDKLETAISIGKSTKFIHDAMHVMIVQGSTKEEVQKEFDDHLTSLETSGEDMHVGSNATSKIDVDKNAFVITGQALIFALQDAPDKFLSLGEKCISVICCRVSPLQKAQVVKLVRRRSNRICLSIGDGANDVSMIQTANIGVGIIGLEGTQAVRASDYAFKEFRSLRRLISVHGRYSYLRMSQLIYYSFYKNIAFIMVQFWWGLYSGWSGQVAYQEIVMTGFNLAITALPPFFLCIFERDVDDHIITKYPQSYVEVRAGRFFNHRTLFGWVLTSLWHSVVIFFASYLVFKEGNLGGGEVFYDYWTLTCFNATFAVTLVLSKWAMVVRAWVWPQFAGLLISYLIYIIGIFIIAAVTATYADIPSIALSLSTLYFGLFACLAIALIPDLIVQYFRRVYFYWDGDILQEMDLVTPNQAPSDIAYRVF